MRRPSIYSVASGVLAVENLLSPYEWVQDKLRTHCSVCIQQFYTFKRRHHCRTCGEVVCSSCSKHRQLRLIDENIDMTARICILCVTRASKATHTIAIDRLTLLGDLKTPSDFYPMQTNPLDDSSVFDTMRLDEARCADTQHPNKDDTLRLLVHLVARSLECSMVFLGFVCSKGMLHVQEMAGLDVDLSTLVDMCVPVLKRQTTIIIRNTLKDANVTAKMLNANVHYYAGTPIVLHGQIMGALVAMDGIKHVSTSIIQRNTLESIARIAAEILEQRGLDPRKACPTCHSKVDPPFSQHVKSSRPSSNQADTGYQDAIESVLQLYRILHGCSWEHAKIALPLRQNPQLEYFTFHERYQHGYIKAVTQILVPPMVPLQNLLDIHQPIYSNCLLSLGERISIDYNTNLDQVVFQPGCSWARAKQYPLLSHWRDFEGGASIFLGMQLRDDFIPEFCFGWMISPTFEYNQAIVSVIVPQHKEIEEAVMIGDWLMRLIKMLQPNRHQRARSFSVHDKTHVRTTRSNTLDSRPQTEAFFWSVLEKTISTQRLLSERQEDMMQTLESNGLRIAGLSQAIERVENKLG
ncbi:hypothetical protein THRCLA_11962 [Thraustotheca clavata]|uniref:FYVE-type domain-containing protein n=1 Tax=Thraustotheca clavata TaxID=74557 RepID=A0A1V9Y4J3_9STRA|nr:hypothetical protein THRCLA_11962 [Thraustotheca clavata]